MSGRSYYSVRTGRISDNPKLELEMLRGLFVACYNSFEEKGYFQERLGINCADGYIPGNVGDVEIYSFRKLRRKGLFPIWARQTALTEDEIFDLIEFLYDHASQPTGEGSYHSWNQCGYHYTKFIHGTAQREFRTEVNEFLKDYGDGYELSESGEILTRPGGALDALLEAPIPARDASNITARVNAAVIKFRRRSASEEERRDAIRDLADVLEFLRPDIKQALNHQDEADLFNIANNFGIRHHNASQKTNYDKMIWFSWIFYFYLATIHAALRLIEKGAANPQETE
jgi:hypothetical protein